MFYTYKYIFRNENKISIVLQLLIVFYFVYNYIITLKKHIQIGR